MLQRSHNTPTTAADSPCAASGGAGLVTSATTGREEFAPDDAREIFDGLAAHFRFPSAELVGAAAALFDADAITEGAWHPLPPDPRRVPIRHDYAEHTEWRAGVRPRLTIGPGVLRLSRVDLNRAEATAERAREAAARDAEIERDMLTRPMALALVDLSPERVVSDWSARSRSRMMEMISSLDLSELASGARVPCMVTLTLPGDWLAVAPTAKRAAELLGNLARAWARRWDSAPSWIWKREFQRRGAPHWHLWLVPPTSDSADFREWLSATWTRILNPSRVADAGRHLPPSPGRKCVCSEYCRSLAAGTGVDYAEGMRSSDPRRLAVYFLKETLGGEEKAYQNGPPREWQGQSVGRYWGVRGLKPATTTVPISPEAAERVWREMRKLRIRLSPVLTRTVERTNQRTGAVSTRRATRRRVVYGSAGFVLVNDGAAFAAQLARLLDPPTSSPWSRRDPSTMPAPRASVSA